MDHLDITHIHLLLNHFPIIGMMIALALFLTSFFSTTDHLRRGSLIVFVAIALLTIPAFMSGIGAQVKLTESGVPNTLIQRHEGAAELAIWFVEIAGGLALIGLWQFRRFSRQATWNVIAILAFSVIGVALMARVGNTGGDIRHPEIQASPGTTAHETIASFEPSPGRFTSAMTISKWWWAFMMDLHFIGLVLLMGAMGILNMRVLGFAKQLPIAPLNKLIPWGIAGFGINLVTGILAFIGMPLFYTYDKAFVLKMVSILIAAACLGLYYVSSAFRDCESVGPGQDAPIFAKVIAGSSLILWFAVIILGRYIQPFADTISH
jgi:uncharacterized membrane protein